MTLAGFRIVGTFTGGVHVIQELTVAVAAFHAATRQARIMCRTGWPEIHSVESLLDELVTAVTVARSARTPIVILRLDRGC